MVPRSDIALIPGIFHPVQSTTTSDEDARSRLAGRRGVEERQKSRDHIPAGKALGDGRRPAVGLPEGPPQVLYYIIIRCYMLLFTFTPCMAMPYSFTR